MTSLTNPLPELGDLKSYSIVHPSFAEGWLRKYFEIGFHMAQMELFNLKIVVDRIEGRSVCGMQVGDYFELENSSELKIPTGKHFCIYALQSVLPFLPAKQRALLESDWLNSDSEFACPDPEERLIMRVERTNVVTLDSSSLT